MVVRFADGTLAVVAPFGAVRAGAGGSSRACPAFVMNTTARPVAIPAEAGVTLQGDLLLPDGASGVVLFAHGSGSSRHSPRNRWVANVLNDARVGTLLFDLLSEVEEERDRSTGHLRFNIPLLGERLVAATDWLSSSRYLAPDVAMGYFGASTGAAAALVAAAQRPGKLAAIVSRGGRPDLAGDALRAVKAPTLFIVGGNDREVLRLNQWALKQMTAPATLEIVPGATHLFDEHGAIEQVARLAVDWFQRCFRPSPGH
jgi:dienelactone hydrolase